MSLFQRLFSRRDGRDRLVPLYNAVIAEARQPAWYRECGVADTLDGRFDMVAATMALVLIRLGREGEAGAAPAALLTELFIEDMDGQLREDGIGDVVVGKHMGRMMSALGGRIGAYREGLEGRASLEEALVRNLYRSDPPTPERVAKAAARMRERAATIDATPLDALLAGRIA